MLIFTWQDESVKLFYCINPLMNNSFNHRISIPAYAIEQQWWQLGVSKNEMSLMSYIFKMMLVLYQSGWISGVSDDCTRVLTLKERVSARRGVTRETRFQWAISSSQVRAKRDLARVCITTVYARIKSWNRP
jgi:hypothetical protein